MTYPANRRAWGHVYKRGPVWYARYTVAGKRRDESTRSRRRADAVKLLAQRQAEIESGSFAVATVPAPTRTPLYTIRTGRRLTQAEVARIAGLKDSYISKLERGAYPEAFNWLVRIADALATTTDALLGRETVAVTVPDALARADHELLDRMERHAIALIGPDLLARGGGWRTIAERGWLAYLFSVRDQDLVRSDNAAPPIEEREAKRRTALHRLAKKGYGSAMTALAEGPAVEPTPRAPDAQTEMPVVLTKMPAFPRGWFAGWESDLQKAHRLDNQALLPAPRDGSRTRRERRARIRRARRIREGRAQ